MDTSLAFLNERLERIEAALSLLVGHLTNFPRLQSLLLVVQAFPDVRFCGLAAIDAAEKSRSPRCVCFARAARHPRGDDAIRPVQLLRFKLPIYRTAWLGRQNGENHVQ